MKRQERDEQRSEAGGAHDAAGAGGGEESAAKAGRSEGGGAPAYRVEDGLRWVEAYDYVHRMGVRERWAGKALLQVFKDEFAALPASYYEAAIANGRIRVNGRPSKATHRLSSREKIQHRQHVHEPPVVAGPIPIVATHDDVYVVNKPASIPVHPTGLYRHNTVVGILANENGLADLHPVHRIDRLASGLLIVARTPERAQQLSEQIAGREVHKEYLARVLGRFPEGDVECAEPIEKPDFKEATCRVSAGGQAALTKFTRLAYDGHTSLVRCMPLTGRTHQIRVHLQHLGHPIANDPVYASPPPPPPPPPTPAPAAAVAPAAATVVAPAAATAPASEFLSGDAKALEIACAVCETTVAVRDTEHMCLWLHALRYTAGGRTFEVPPPPWAHPDARYPLYALPGQSDKLAPPK